MAGVVLEVLGALKKITEPLYLYLSGHFSLVFLFVFCFNNELGFKIIEYIIIMSHMPQCMWKSENILRLFLSFHCGFWRLNSGHQTWMSSTFT